jgi:hypothetical protein
VPGVLLLKLGFGFETQPTGGAVAIRRKELS